MERQSRAERDEDDKMRESYKVHTHTEPGNSQSGGLYLPADQKREQIYRQFCSRRAATASAVSNHVFGLVILSSFVLFLFISFLIKLHAIISLCPPSRSKAMTIIELITVTVIAVLKGKMNRIDYCYHQGTKWVIH